MRLKVYVILKADPRTGACYGEPVAAKLTRAAAQAIAKNEAPAKVVLLVADKG